MAPRSFVTRKSDTLAADMAVSATSATLTSGNFGTPTYTMVLTIDGDVPAKAADYECAVSSTGVSSMTLLNGPNVAHSAGATVWAGLVDEHMDGFTDFTGTTASLASTAWTPSYTGFSGTPTTTLARYHKIGRLVFVRIFFDGTSNATGLTFTLPFAAARSGRNNGISIFDNGTWQSTVGIVSINASSTTANVYKDANSTAFTNANGKGIDGSFFYESTT